jgi:hypothetical protein
MFHFVCLRNLLIYFNPETMGERLYLSMRISSASVCELSPVSVNNPVENFPK